jgi:flagellar basal body rod protein FlgG
MDGLDWSASAMRAARAQLDVATHNLANAGSDGFRRVAARVELGPDGLRVRTETTPGQGAVRATGRPFDLALLGAGSFHVGTAMTRNGAFTRDRDGWVVDDRGHRLWATCGALRLSDGATIASDGTVHDRGRIVDRLPLPTGTRVLSGSLETSTVNPIDQTLAILTAQRAFETAQKTMVAIDATREKSANDVGRLK